MSDDGRGPHPVFSKNCHIGYCHQQKKLKGLILQIIRDDKNENTRVNIEFCKAKKDKEI